MTALLFLLSFFSIFITPVLKDGFVKKFVFELRYFVYFFAGMLMFFNFSFFRKSEKFFIFPAIVISVLCFIYPKDYFLIIYPVALCIVIFFVAFHFPILEKTCKFGDLSYGMYIVHFPVIRILCLTDIFLLHPIVGIIFVFVISFGLAVLIDLYIQLPLIKLIKTRGEK